VLLLGTIYFSTAVTTWPKAGGGLYNANLQAMRGDYTGGFVEVYRTDCLPLSISLSSASTYTQFSVDDIDGDGNNEVVAHAIDHVCAFDGSTGTPLWYYPIAAGHDATPLLEDVDSDGQMEVVIITRTRVAPGPVKVEAVNGADGSLEWSYTMSLNSLSTSSPTAYDIDGDGDKDVLAGCDDDTLYVLDGSTGTPLWKFGAGGDVKGTPAIGNGYIALADFSGRVYMLTFAGTLIWTYNAGSPIYASPVMGQLDGTGMTDVIVATLGSGAVIALRGDDGSLLWSYSMPTGVRTTPILADVDGDSELEVVVGDTAGNIRVLNAHTGVEEEAFATSPLTGINPYWAMISADIYPTYPGLEILITTDVAFRSAPNRTFIYSYDGVQLFFANNTGDASAIADVDNDGCMEFITENEGTYLPRGTRYSVYDSPTNADSSCVLLGRDTLSLSTGENALGSGGDEILRVYDQSGRIVPPFSYRHGVYLIIDRKGARKVLRW